VTKDAIEANGGTDRCTTSLPISQSTGNVRAVAIGEIATSDAPNDVLVAYGLGSCVAICLYDPVAQAGGMLHALLPTAPDKSKTRENRPKFVDEGVPMLLEALSRLGVKRHRLTVRLCGGADVLSALSLNGTSSIGKRNVLAAEAALLAAGLKVQAQATRGNIGRTVKLHISNGLVTVRSLGHAEQALEIP